MSVKTIKYSGSHEERWDLVDHVCGGSQTVKAAGTKYLPMPNPTDDDAKEIYKQYKERAVFLSATTSTLNGMLGLSFKKKPTVLASERLSPVIEDANGDGVTLVQSSRKALSEVLKKGRCGLLADYPATEGATSVREESEQGIRPTISRYDSKSIINWRTKRYGAVTKLSLVVLSETYTVEDEFTEEEHKQYRQLLLDESGLYVVRIWRENEKGDAFEVTEEYWPTSGTGQRLNYIPFYFIGAENNDHEIDDAPLYDLATINIAHYRNSADYEEGVFICGQPWVYVTGLDQDWLDKQMGGSIKGGASNANPLPVGGSLGIEQAQPNMVAKEAMDQKEKLMVMLGARLIEEGGAKKTATQAEGDNETNHSVLSLCCENVSAAYTGALMSCAEFMNDSSEIRFSLNLDAGVKKVDSQALTALVTTWQQGAYSWTQLIRNLRRMDLVDPDKSDEEIKEEIESEVI